MLGRKWYVTGVCALLLMAVQTTGGEDTILYKVDMETPEFLAIYNNLTGDIDIYTLEHPNRTVAAGAASIEDYHTALDAGAYDYPPSTGGLAWSPLETEHAPDGMVDSLIVVSISPEVGIVLAKLINEGLKEQGCGADFKNHPIAIDGSFDNAMNWWVFEGYSPSPAGGWDGIIEYCETHG